jgi:hypothetical protein
MSNFSRYLATVIDTGDRAANLDLFLKHSWLLVVRVILLAKFTARLDLSLYGLIGKSDGRYW